MRTYSFCWRVRCQLFISCGVQINLNLHGSNKFQLTNKFSIIKSCAYEMAQDIKVNIILNVNIKVNNWTYLSVSSCFWNVSILIVQMVLIRKRSVPIHLHVMTKPKLNNNFQINIIVQLHIHILTKKKRKRNGNTEMGKLTSESDGVGRTGRWCLTAVVDD